MSALNLALIVTAAFASGYLLCALLVANGRGNDE